jgi:hypothetical protein
VARLYTARRSAQGPAQPAAPPLNPLAPPRPLAPTPQISQPLVPLVDEFAARLFGELDYVAEGRNCEKFQVGGGGRELGVTGV